MRKRTEVLAIIPARGGSKGIRNKNIRNFCGKPLIAYTIEQSKASRFITRTVVSTDSKEIAKVARTHGAEVPLLRPKELAGDQSQVADALFHILRALKEKEGYEPDYVLLLYPTSPLLSRERIEQAIALAVEKNAGSVVSGHYDKGHYWLEADGGWKRLYPIELVNSQYQKPLFIENGAIYMTRASLLR